MKPEPAPPVRGSPREQAALDQAKDLISRHAEDDHREYMSVILSGSPQRAERRELVGVGNEGSD